MNKTFYDVALSVDRDGTFYAGTVGGNKKLPDDAQELLRSWGLCTVIERRVALEQKQPKTFLQRLFGRGK